MSGVTKVLDKLLSLDEDSEGFHMIEHILLRPLESVSYLFSFFDLKGDVENLLQLGGLLQDCRFESSSHPALHAGQCAAIRRGEQQLGWLGALDPRLQREWDIADRVYLFELDLSALLQASVPAFRALSKFPEVSRDLALMVDRNLPVADIESHLRELAGENLVGLRIFDVYQGDKIESDKKSVALGLTWQHPSRTLGDDDIQAIIERCVKGLDVKINAKLRN
jgi:phenylalanyl-tRNA synthetase beta chain